MKAAPFRYASPSSVAEAVALLASDEGAKPISGGQSLMPMMAFRLAAPTLLVDLRKIPELDRIAIDANGVRLGARVRWRDILSDERLATAHPLLRNAISHVAHYQVRNRGTVGGSLAHADPAAEMPGIAATVGAEITVVGAAGTRIVAAKDFFVGPLQTVLDAGELIVEVALPAWRAGRRWAFEEFARRRGDFALAGVALHYDVDANGRAGNAHFGAIGATSAPRRLTEAEAALNGQVVDASTIDAVGRAVGVAVDPFDDLHASAAYRRSLVQALAERALARAAAQP